MESVSIYAVRTTLGRENIVLKSISIRVKKNPELKILSAFHPEDLRGYLFVEGDYDDIAEALRDIQHVKGIVPHSVDWKELEGFMIAEKQEVKISEGDIVEIVSGPFKGEKAKVIRVDDNKKEIIVEPLDAVIPISVTIPLASARLHKRKEGE